MEVITMTIEESKKYFELIEESRNILSEAVANNDGKMLHAINVFMQLEKLSNKAAVELSKSN